jgi:hypothetical protein
MSRGNRKASRRSADLGNRSPLPQRQQRNTMAQFRSTGKAFVLSLGTMSRTQRDAQRERIKRLEEERKWPFGR